MKISQAIQSLTFLGLTGLMLLSTFSSTANESSTNETDKHYEDALQSFYASKYDSAIIHLKNVLKAQPKHLPARLLLVENLVELNKGHQAEIEIRSLETEKVDRNRTAPLLAQSLLIQGKSQAVLDIAIPSNAKPRIKSQLLAYRGLAYLTEEKQVLARGEFNEALTLNKRNTTAMLGIAKIHVKNKAWQSALKQIQSALAIAPKDKQALFMAAIVNQLNHNNSAALKHINALLALSPTHYSALLTRAMILIKLGELEAANTDILKVAQKFPSEPITQFASTISATSPQSNDESTLELSALVDTISEEIKQKQPVYYLLSALSSIKQQAFTNAEKSLVQYHRLAPNDMAGLKLLARTRISLANPFAAKKDLFKARTIEPNDIETWSLLGQVSVLTGESEKAKYYFNEVLKKQPLHADATINLAKLTFIDGNNKQTIKLLSPLAINTLNSNEQIEVLLLLAKAYQAQQQLPKAIALTEQLITLHPNNSYAHQFKGSLLGLSGNIKAAHKSYLIANQLNENNFQVIIYLARLEFALGQTSQAIQRLENSNNISANSAIMIELASTSAKLNQPAQEIQWYEKALAHNPASMLAMSKLLNLHIKNNDLDKSYTLIEQFIDKNEKNAEAHHMAAQLFLNAGNSNKALSYMNKAVKLSENKALRFEQLAKLQLNLNLRDKAKLSLEKSIAWNENQTSAYIMLIALSTDENNESLTLSLIKQLEGAFKRQPKETKLAPHVRQTLLLNLKANFYWVTKKVYKAKWLFNKSLSISKTQDAVIGLYRVLRKLKSYELITPLLEQWLTEQPNDLQMTIALAENYHQQGQVKKAQSFYQSMLKINPNNALLLNNAAVLYRKNNELRNALLLAEKAHNLAPNNVNIIDTKAAVLIAKGEYKNALSLLRKANTLDYDNAEVKYHLAITLDKLQRRNEAIDHLTEAVESEQHFDEKADAKKLLSQWL